MFKKIFVFLLLFSFITITANAADRFVSPSGNNAGDCTNDESPCLTIQYTIDQSSDGDVITIAAGTYSENITIAGKTLVLSGASAKTTIIDGGDNDSVFTLTHTVSNENVVMDGLTIQNGLSNVEAGGIFVDINGVREFDLTLTDIIFKNNDNTNVNGIGGALSYKNAGDLSLERVTFENNSATRGAGIAITDVANSVYLTNVTFFNNNATAGNLADGGAISTQSDILVNNSTLVSNSAGSGGGIWGASDATITLTNTILDNETGNNCALEETSSISSDGNNISSDNSCTGLSAGSDDQINTDPLLKETLADNGGDVTTLGFLENSPAIDTGNNLSCDDFDATKDERPSDGDNDGTATCDIGAYESVCGDSIIDGAEECDNGNANSDVLADACRSDCTNPVCGDGVQDSGESCDDGNDNNTDSCLNSCATASCGDGFIQSGEECDDGDDNSNVEADACRATCVEASCGDSVVDDGEECDDGNATNNDTCTNSCTSVAESNEDDDEETSTCGDSVVDDGEECDDGNTINVDGCSSSCEIEEYNDIENEDDSDVDFQSLTVSEMLDLNAPNPTNEIDLDLNEFCDCLWNLNPNTLGSLSSNDACSTILTIEQSGQANLMISVDCADLGSSTYNQTLLTNESADNGGYTLTANGCSLNNQTESQNKATVFMIAIFMISLFGFRRYCKKL